MSEEARIKPNARTRRDVAQRKLYWKSHSSMFFNFIRQVSHAAYRKLLVTNRQCLAKK